MTGTPSPEALRITLAAYFAAIAARDPNELPHSLLQTARSRIPSVAPSAMAEPELRRCSPPG